MLSLCLQVLLYTIVVIKLFTNNEKLIKNYEKNAKVEIEYFCCFLQ